MPIYEYKCDECGKATEVIHGSNENPKIVCSICGGSTKKIFSPAGLVFKGSGFYKTDSRSASCGGGSCPSECPNK